MPKKLPLYWSADANCNKLSSKPLRCLREKPNKLTSGPTRIHSLCESLKSKHFKANKKEKFRQIEDFRGFLSTETILARHKKEKPRLRQVLQTKVNDTYNSSLKNLSSNSSWKKRCSNTMAVDFDHMYIDCGDSKISIGRDIEFQHLKELNLLHLDLIQQQAEQLISKDKIIKTLKEENKNLRARLERIDRRVSLSLQKKPNDLSPISVQTDFGEDASFPFCVKPESSPRSPGYRSPSARSPTPRGLQERSPQSRGAREDDASHTDSSSSKRDLLKRISSPKQQTSSPSLSPIQQQILRVSPREKRAKKDGTQAVVDVPIARVTAPDLSCTLNPSLCDTRKSRSPTSKRNLVVETPTPSKKNKFVESDEKDKANSTEEEGITNHSLRSRDKSRELSDESPQLQPPKSVDGLSSLQSSSHPPPLINEKIKSNTPIISCDAVEGEPWKPTFKGSATRKVRSEGILTTTDSYYLPSHHSSLYLLNSAEEEDQTQVELPKWRIKVLSSLYVMEGTENLEDEIFLKRHGKPEQDERRRKRWDLQRMREQRQYEKLRERYEVRNNKSGSRCGSRQSLWPIPESATSLHIDSYLPVCAFGQPLAQITESEFFVPWLTGKSPLQVGLSTRRKRR